MVLHLEITGGAMLIRLSGEIDLAVADNLRSSMEEKLDQNPEVKHIVVNLSGVTYIDSSGLGVLLGRYRRLSREGGGMSVVGASPAVRKIIEMSGLLRIMKEFQSEEEAVRQAG